jgi:UDP-N-acetyl-D-mannosaminuronic acid dehydrogenase
MAILTENSCRDEQIAFAHELSVICDKLDINVWELISLANRHPRINILQPGPGVGGHCIAVDPWFIVSSAEDQAKLIRQARDVNDSKPYWVIDKVKSMFTDFLLDNPNVQQQQVKIGVFGLAFKANIDDLRESPSMKIAEELACTFKDQLRVVEPNISELPVGMQEQMSLVSIEEGLRSDVVVILVDHREFQEESLFEGQRYIIDTKGILG